MSGGVAVVAMAQNVRESKLRSGRYSQRSLIAADIWLQKFATQKNPALRSSP
jgi:hypothetical protein